MTTRRVAWRRSDEIETDEVCTLTLRDTGYSMVGTVLGADAGAPLRIEYQVLVDRSGLTTAAHVRDLRGFATRTLAVERYREGRVDGQRRRGSVAEGLHGRRPRLQPSTNTLPIRRLNLAIGASQTIKAAWVRFPELEVVKADQTYTRLDEFTYRYASGTFEGEISVDDDGLVTVYEVWKRTGYAVGPDDTAPLDAQR